MTEHPVLVSTSVGVTGAIVASPDDAAVARVVILGPGAGTHAGTNQLFVRLARRLAADGLLSLRFDWAGAGESHDVAADDRAAAAAEVLAWFRDRTEGTRELVIGACSGSLDAGAVSAGESPAAGVALLGPPVFQLPEGTEFAGFGGNAGRDTFAAQLGQMADAAPVWILTGDQDVATPILVELAGSLLDPARCQVDVLHDTAVRGFATGEVQEAVIDRTAAWASRVLAPQPA